MTAIPDWMFRHTATVKPLVGEGAYGPVYGQPEEHPCLADDKRQLVRDATGLEVVSDTTLYFKPGVVCPPGSQVTVNGRTTTAITSLVRDGGGLPTPDHVEVALK
ncbi:hypothetical protein [Nonomuraea rhizosphaerae]|uniref:hypothetical protein n=1 Tax=Nonomuraea rhizosphaerae TaxID=2665663 RepID=UPI001C5E52E2|nr:hypothetical protein [Nonomuraea rhizosphaerae]